MKIVDRIIGRYTQYASFEGSHNPIVSLSISEKGTFIAGAGIGGVGIWDVKTLAPVSVPYRYMSPTEPRYQVSVCSWLFFELNARHVLLLGTFDGDLVAWQYNETKRIFESSAYALPKPTAKRVTSLHVYDANVSPQHYARIVVSYADNSVGIWKLSSTGDFVSVSSNAFDPAFKARVVRFDGERSIWAFSQDSGRIAVLPKKEDKFQLRKEAGPKRIGDVAMDSSNDRLVVSTGKDFQVLSISTLKHLKTFERSAPTTVLSPKQVRFVERGCKLIAGTDSAHAAMYDVEKGKLEQKLVYPRGGLVQTVASGQDSDWSYVAVAGSTAEQPSDIIIWRRRLQTKAWATLDSTSPKPLSFYAFLLAALIGVVCALFLYQTFQPTLTISMEYGGGHSALVVTSHTSVPLPVTHSPGQIQRTRRYISTAHGNKNGGRRSNRKWDPKTPHKEQHHSSSHHDENQPFDDHLGSASSPSPTTAADVATITTENRVMAIDEQLDYDEELEYDEEPDGYESEGGDGYEDEYSAPY
ncbi:hypothetical protein VNI00_015372 [Paramarasmius palmivorus]|uniref:WD40 repeat-like protein n=1 Tax=Paramarasmius palmivorus TaxID=297713 RepID=A0AAW0BGT4_9AGAR